MNLVCEKSALRGRVEIPGSKSHTIRAVAIAALANGESVVRQPLESQDARSAVAVYRQLGADIETGPGLWRIRGVNAAPRVPDNVVDVGNSGTTLNVALGSCALLTSARNPKPETRNPKPGLVVLTGDEQIRRRPSGPLAASLNDLGASVRSTRDNGCPPFVVAGRLRGGETTLEALSSQYLTSLLLNCPLGEGETRIHVPLLYEAPYVEMTLDWLRRQGIQFEEEGLREFRIPGGQRYAAFDRRIPADFSSATFFLAAGALPENDVLSAGIDMSDTQGDKAVVEYLRRMGAHVRGEKDGVRRTARKLTGCELDLNATPDALPMMAVLACFAHGETRLVNVPQARIKETDRITVMRRELGKLGANVTELADGLVVRESTLCAADVDGHGDHRVIMALAIAGTRLSGRTVIHGCEAAAVTYPGFVDALTALGGKARIEA